MCGECFLSPRADLSSPDVVHSSGYRLGGTPTLSGVRVYSRSPSPTHTGTLVLPQDRSRRVEGPPVTAGNTLTSGRGLCPGT